MNQELRRDRLRIAWFSTWNSRCGIAEHTAFLNQHLDPERIDATILASSREELTEEDDDRVIRCWSGANGSIVPLLSTLRLHRFDALIIQTKIQYGFGYLSLPQLEEVIACCNILGAEVVVLLHATDGIDDRRLTVHRAAQSLRLAKAILVHSDRDIARLQSIGLTRNVHQFPQGCLSLPNGDLRGGREQLGISQDSFVIASYGFLLPNKGIDKLIEAVHQLRTSGQDAHLLLVNALYPAAVSQECLAIYQDLVRTLGIEQHVTFESRFLQNEESLGRLAAADVVIFPYQQSAESASGAVRMGLASRRPVLCSPIDMFADVRDALYVLPGTEAADIVTGLSAFLSDSATRLSLADAQADWIKEHAWPKIAELLQQKYLAQTHVLTPQAVPEWILNHLIDRCADVEAAQTEATALRNQLSETKAETERRVLELEHAWGAKNDELTSGLADLVRTRDQLDRSLAEMQDKILLAQSKYTLEAQEASRWQRLADDRAERLHEVLTSRSWRITLPLRRLRSLIIKLRALTGASGPHERLQSPSTAPPVARSISREYPQDLEPKALAIFDVMAAARERHAAGH